MSFPLTCAWLLSSLLLVAPLSALAGDSVSDGDAQQELSLYDLQVGLEDATGARRPFDFGRGGPVLVTMFYATCLHACPLLISRIRSAEAKLSEEERGRLRVLLVSFDGDKDTPEKMAALGKAYGLDTKRWVLARTDEAAVRELAAVLGIRYRFASSGAIHHTSVITLLDEQGVVRARLEDMEQPLQPLVEATQRALRR